MSEKKFDIFRLSMGQRRFESGPHKWTVAWRKAAKLNVDARRAFKEGRIMYDVPEYVTEERTGSRDPTKRARKTTDEYEIQGMYGHHGWEVVTTESTFKEARARLREYRENEPGVPHRLVKKQLRIQLRLPGVRDPGMETKKDGKRYALEYIQGDYFMDFVHEQMLYAHKHPESHWQIQSKADALRAAKNTFQDLTWSMGRDISAPKAFWEGVREALSTKRTLNWLATELMYIEEDLKRSPR